MSEETDETNETDQSDEPRREVERVPEQRGARSEAWFSRRIAESVGVPPIAGSSGESDEAPAEHPPQE